MIKEEMTSEQAIGYLKVLVALDTSQIVKDTLDYFEKLQKENEELKSKANKWDRITSGVYFKDGKQRSKWCLKIKNQYDWISYLSILREKYKQDESELLRVVNHLDCQVLVWALDSLKEEVMRYKND